MPVEILMPALSPTMTKGKLIKWHKNIGDQVQSSDIIAEVETDKATMEIEVFEDGTIGELLVKENQADISVNSAIAVILLEGESKESLKDFVINKPQDAEDLPSDISSTVRYDRKESKQEDIEIRASPLAKRLAKDKNIDLTQIKGSGPHGRIVKQDILAKLANTTQENNLIKQSIQKENFVEVSSMRKTIAERLLFAKQTIPHFYLTLDCLVDKLLALKDEMNDLVKERFKLTINDFIIKALACAMRDFPDVNASWQEDKIHLYNSINIAVAVAIPNGLITPIVRNADHKSMGEISQNVKELAIKAKDSKLVPEEYTGGSITISNLGMFGIENFSAIINPPQSCILAVGCAIKRPIVTDNTIAIATTMSVTLSVDHRIVDGVLGAQFLNAFKKYIEKPMLMFT